MLEDGGDFGWGALRKVHMSDLAPAPPEGSWTPIPGIWGTWVVTANRHGTEGEREYPGSAWIADPAGSVRASLEGEGWVGARIGIYL